MTATFECALHRQYLRSRADKPGVPSNSQTRSLLYNQRSWPLCKPLSRYNPAFRHLDDEELSRQQTRGVEGEDPPVVPPKCLGIDLLLVFPCALAGAFFLRHFTALLRDT